MKTSWIAAALVPASLVLGCGDADDLQPRGVEFVHVEKEAAPHQVSLAGETEDAVIARALFARDHERARIEVEIDGDRFLAQLDPEASEFTILAEVDGETVLWDPSEGGAMPEAIAARWSDVLAAWRAEMIGDDGRLRPESRGAVNVPADAFVNAVNGVPVSQTIVPWCPGQEMCWYDDATATFVCELAYDIWCPPPPPPCYGIHCDPYPCGGMYCPLPEPCTDWSCPPPPCVGLWCGPCAAWDPFCLPTY
jgi:hypothetical protein